jgi:hypothetical protein
MILFQDQMPKKGCDFGDYLKQESQAQYAPAKQKHAWMQERGEVNFAPL